MRKFGKISTGALVALVMAVPLPIAAEEIVIGVASVRKGHDNRTETSNASTGIFYAIHEALIERDAFRPGVFIPGLATEWEMIDEDTMELKLREGVTFHNGDTMDAYDVEASLDPIIKLENRRYRNPHGKMFYNFEDVEVVDDMTVRIHTKRPDALMETLLSVRNAGIRSLDRINDGQEDQHGLHPIGAGPYKVASIVPGETALSDLSGDVHVRDRDGNEEHNSDYVIQRGDLVGIFHGAEMMDFTQHNGFYGYVLRDGETELPPEILRLWDQAMELRDIFRRNIAAGLTGEENLDAVVARIEEAGYLHIQENSYDATADSGATQVYIDFHAQGRFVSEVHAPRISATGWGRGLTIPLYHTFALSYAIHMPVPAWGEGERLYLAMHDGATVTERGVEFPAPLPQQIRAIR